MSLRFIYGRSGSGKTYYCLQEIKERLQHSPEHALVLLVPEQYTFQAERELMAITAQGGLWEAEVLSFRRLAFKVFNQAGGLAYPHLQAAGKCMLIYKVLQGLKEQLPFFSKSAERQGFVTTISTLLTEFKRYNISPQELIVAGDALTDELLKVKLAELAAIYKEYQDLLSESYRDLDDDLTLAAVKMENTDLFLNAEIWIDGFSGFTPQEYSLIAQLGRRAKRINISLCTDSLLESEEREATDVFASVKECWRRLNRLAAEEGLEIEKPVCLNQAEPLPRFKESVELSHLEKYFFEYPHKVYSLPTKDIALFSAVNIFAEIEAAARDIIRLCRDQGLRYRDITLITGDLANYGRLIEVIFKEFNIPYFLDSKIEITQNPLIRLILAMLDIFIDNWSYEAVFRYLKTGLAGVEKQSIDLIENYVLACGIRGSRWTRDGKWDWSTEILPSETEDNSDNDLEEINLVRNKITAPLLAFRQKTKGSRRAVDICTALYEFLEHIDVPRQIEKQIEVFRGKGQLNLANEYTQIWNILMHVLDQTVEVLGEETMNIAKFAKILKIGLDEYKLGLIPPSLDQVLVGDAHRSKSHEVKALYILGVNDGIFPTAALEEGLLSDQDRAVLKSLGLELASDTRTQAFDEQYLIYKALTTACSYLRISWPLADSEGRSLRPSMIIPRMRKLFPRLVESSDILPPSTISAELELVTGHLPTFQHLAAKISRQDLKAESKTLWQEVYHWYAGQESFQPQCEAFKSIMAYKNIASPVSPAKILSLYGNPLKTSVSRMEKYASCPFAFYLQYGLKARERKVFSLSPPDIGSFMHKVLELFSREMAVGNISWRTLERDWCEKKIEEIIENLLARMNGRGLSSSPRMTVLMTRLKRVVTRAVWVIAEHIRRSSFEPLGYEIAFGEGEKLPPIIMELESGQKISLSGVIDRVDALKTEEGTYVRIIDYKSGSKDFQLADVYYGLQIQLITYLSALTGNCLPGVGDPLLPGGILYFRLDDPLIRTSHQSSEQQIEEAIMKQLKMKGLLLANVKLIKAMDKEIQGSSLIIPARINKGDVLGKSSTATPEQFSLLQKHVYSLLKQLGAEISSGQVEIRPIKKKKYTACQYCIFAAICQFDPRLKENKYKLLPEPQEEEIWKLLDPKKGGETVE